MNDPRLGEVLASIPEDRCFLETDEDAVSIREIYGKAAAIRNIDVDTLIVQQRKNATAVFGDSAKIQNFGRVPAWRPDCFEFIPFVMTSSFRLGALPQTPRFSKAFKASRHGLNSRGG